MKVSAEKQEGQVVLNIEVEPEEVEKAKGRAYRSLVTRYTVPGFRRGKAPRAMLERYVGPSVVLNEAIRILIPELYDQALKEHNVDAIAEPEIDITSYDPVTVKATVPVRPVVELGDYKSIRVQAETVSISEQEVDQSIEQIRLQRARWEAVERPVEMGDNVIMDLHGTASGRTVVDQKDMAYLVRPGSDQPAPGFAEALVGTAINQEKEIRLSFPADHAAERLAGKDFVYKATVHRVEGRQLPEVNEEFVKTLGLPNVEDLEQLRSYLRDALQREAEAAARARVEDKVISQVVEGAKIEYAPALAEQQVDFMVKNRTELLQQQGIGLEQWLKYLGKTEAELRDELRPQARDLMRRELMLQQVAHDENLQAEPGEIVHQLDLASKEGGEQPDQFAIIRHIQRVKALRRLVEIATEGAITYPSLAGETAAAAEPSAESAAAEPAEGEAAAPATTAPAVEEKTEPPTAQASETEPGATTEAADDAEKK